MGIPRGEGEEGICPHTPPIRKIAFNLDILGFSKNFT
jgi:hypothetical protein